jgi:hypothetical protein
MFVCKSRNWKSHNAAITVFKLRTMSFTTMTRQHFTANFMSNDDPRKKYFEYTYPDKDCPFCLGTQESTDHIITCPNNPDLRRIALEVWNDIYELIEEKQEENKGGQKRIRALYPFALMPAKTETIFWDMHELASASDKRTPVFKAISKFPVNLGAAGYIPKDFKKALKQLNVIKEERKLLVEKIVLKLHNTIQTVIIC